MKKLLIFYLLNFSALAVVGKQGRCNFDRPRNCEEVQLQGNYQSGIYTIFLDDHVENNGTHVYCDMETDGGGWTVFQRRMDTEIQEDFYRGWDDYVNGFGSLSQSFWRGLDVIAELVKGEDQTLRIDLEDFEGGKRYAEYKTFFITNSTDQYRLKTNCFSGNAGDSLSRHYGRHFTTKDKDNDVHQPFNCAEMYKGAWWYEACHESNLNGMYIRGNHSTYAQGIIWRYWKGYYYSLKQTEMKIRSQNYNCFKDSIMKFC